VNDSGFPLRLVEQFNARTGVWRARRKAGELSAEAVLRIGGTSLAELAWDSLNQAPGDVELTARLIERALRLVPRRFDTDARLVELVGSLANRRILVRFMRQHHRLVHIEQHPTTSLLICTEIAPALGVSIDATKDDLVAEAPEQLRAFEMLLAFIMFYSFAVESGDSPRQAMRWIAGLYDQLARRERSHLHHLLESRHLDAGNHVSIFLRRVSEQGADAGHWREQQITWLLGQDRLDLPYNRRAAIDVLMSEADVDDKRFLLYDVVRDYDRDLEGDNILRIAAEVRDRGQQLVFGRMSRAFHNQGTLFANASLLAPQPAWAQLSDQLWQAVSGNAELETVALELKLLLQGSREVALTQIEGACERFEEAVLDAQRDELMGRILDARRLIEDHGDELVQPTLPAMADASVVKATQDRLEVVDEIRRELLSAPSRDAAYVVISQRPSPTGSHLLVKINEFDEPYLGKAANLRKLVRLAGDRVYSSPDYRWLRLADHWIEAIPLFIKEEVLIVDGQEQTRTVIDIAGMEESFREEMSDHWAANIQDVLRSEFAAAARGLLWTARQGAGTADGSSPLADESTILAWAKDQAPDDNTITDSICAIAAAIQSAYLTDPVAAQTPVETAEQEPYQALCAWLDAAPPQTVTGLLEAIGSEQTEQGLSALGSSQSIAWERFGPHAVAPRRALPVLHVLTTQSAGMTEGYVRTWLEESMALHQVVEAAGLAGEVEERQRRFRQRLGALGACIIRELGIWVEVEETAAEEGIEEMSAVGRVVGRNRTVQEEVGVLGALLELQEQLGVAREATDIDDPAEVAQTLADHEESLAEDALVRVADRNGANLEEAIDELLHRHTSLDRHEALRHVVDTDEDFRQDRTTFTRFLARRHLLQSWAAAQGIDAEDRIATYTRRYGRLAKTTARKQVVLEKGLQAQTMHSAHRLAAKGAGKGYHLLYTPSRVDLGHRERESVETWAQWVGGADRAAARAGRQIYGLINKSVRSFDSLTEPEVLKTGENASMASHFAYSNAMSLMVSASGHGDVEEMGDQMSRRGDRIIHPAGEGYGGYCVPKDGLFLEFVLTLGRREKLRQLGIPTEHHDRVASLANALLDRRDDFDTRFAWEAWATDLLADESALGDFMQVRCGAGPGAAPVPVFQVTRLAEVLVGLGQPELRDPERVTAALVARWGIHKMVAGAEHVNRFMPFYKVWLLRRGLNEAERRAGAAGPSGSTPGRPFVCVLSAEYKPDTQDGRFAAGMRKFEILTGSAQHLLYALDSDGQLLATLLSSGFKALAADGRGPRVARMLGLAEGDTGQLSGLFPAPRAAAELRVVSPTGLSTQDLLSYTSDTPLESIAEDARAILLKAGMTEAELEANVLSFGPRIDRWATSAPLESADLNAVAERVGMGIHALALQVAGPERSYDRALQGADVLDLGIPHQELLDMLADPSRVARLMLEDQPDSALVIVDGASGARRRALNRIDVMLWFAVAERLGRESTYVSIGLGADTVESWRVAMRRQRERASGLLAALESGDTQGAETFYRRIINEMHEEQEAQLQLAEVAKLRRFGRLRSRDEALTRSLADLAAGRALQELTFLDFLALGGLFLLDGAQQTQILSTHGALGEGLARLGREAWPSWDDEPAANLVNAQLPPAVEDFREEKGLESSNKASEDRPVVALEARSQLAARVEQARALNERQFAYQAVDTDSICFDEAYSCAKASLGTGGDDVSEAAFGTFLGYARNALFALVQLYEEDNADDAQRFVEHLSQLFMGRQIDNEHWRQIAGGYEDLGDFGRLAQVVAEQSGDEPLRQRQLEMIARGGELFYILLAVDSVLPHIRGEGDAPSLWRALADFFAETINDHFHEYRPWIYSRGIGFAALEGDELYAFSLRHHEWLYRFLRRVVTGFTEVAALPVPEQDLLLGNYLDDAQVGAIGAGAATQVERHWRSYGQLRELAFIRNDGFPLPEVFDDFDPDLIDADKRVNHVIALPVGRTHYSRALREAPTLARELIEQGRPGANLIISRRVEFTQDTPRAQVVVEGGHLYLSAEAYAEALTRHKGVTAAAARAAAQATHAKGRRIAARFSRPVRACVVYPFHGDPDYASGRLEDCGLPYSVQSLFHTWTTYDKAKYPDIFEPQDGVDTPQEIDWLAVDTARAPDEVTARRWITDGIDSGYTGLRAFAGVHRLVMIKDAAESGGRNARAFVLRTVGSSTIDEEALDEALDFIYQVSLRHNVAIQEVIVSSPEYWATAAFLDDFVRRQIIEWGSAVERDRRPKSPLYGSHRVIVSTDDPLSDDPERWHLSHWITLNSKQLITNVGRGGCLEQFLPRYIEPRYHEALYSGLRDAARSAMKALAAYEVRQGHIYEAELGRQVGKDLAGVSYGMPRYLMLDYLVTPHFVEEGDLVEVRHTEDCATFTLQQAEQRIQGTVDGWRIVLIEPNIGVGLWDRVALREEAHELAASRTEGRPFEWDRVGENARIVLRDLSRGGEQYLAALQEQTS